MEQNRHSFDNAQYFLQILRQCPSASADIRGSDEYPAIDGKVSFYQTTAGVLVSIQILGLPVSDVPCRESVFSFHIHRGSLCTGNQEDPFKDALTHYNPSGCEHPNHAGDLIPLFGNNGYAFQIFLTDRISVDEIVGRTVIIHLNPDDFTTQPSGNSGKKIACGQIVRTRRRWDSLGC